MFPTTSSFNQAWFLQQRVVIKSVHALKNYPDTQGLNYLVNDYRASRWMIQKRKRRISSPIGHFEFVRQTLMHFQTLFLLKLDKLTNEGLQPIEPRARV